METTVAAKVRKGQIVRFTLPLAGVLGYTWATGAGKVIGPVRVTKREKWSPTSVKVHFESALFPGSSSSHEYLALNTAMEILTEDQAMVELDKATAP
jgi:hypothetical protein